jgi:hypothetical protein
MNELTDRDLQMGLRETRQEMLRLRDRLAASSLPCHTARIQQLEANLEIREQAHLTDKLYIDKLEHYLWEELYQNTPHRWLKKEIYELIRKDGEEGGCRFNCRTEKENWIEGFNWARWQPAKHDNARDAEVR